MWMHGIFGSQGMIWWWIHRLASSHLQKSPQETRSVIYLLAPAIQILPASQVSDRYSCASLLLGSFTQTCMHKTSSLPTDLPPTSFWCSNLFDSRWSRCSHMSQSSPHEHTLFRCIGNVQHSAGQTLPLTKGLGRSSCFPPHFSSSFFDVKESFQASFGNQLVSCEPLGLFHINVGMIVMPGTWIPRLSHLVSSMCLHQVFLGRLRDWVPICWLVTEGSCVTNLHLLSSVVWIRRS